MTNDIEMMKENATSFDFIEYEKPQMLELTDVKTAFGVNEGDMGQGTNVVFGAADERADHSEDYTDFDLED